MFRADIGKEFVLGALDSFNRQYFISPSVSTGMAKTDYHTNRYHSMKQNFGPGLSFYFTEFTGENPILEDESSNSLARHIMNSGQFWLQKAEMPWFDLNINYSAQDKCKILGANAQKSIIDSFGKITAGIGYSREADSFLCATIEGLDNNNIKTDTVSLFLNYEQKIFPRTKFAANYSYYKSDVEIGTNALNLAISGLSSDAMDVSIEHSLGQAKIKLAYYRPISIRSGIMKYDTIWGYGTDASYLMENKQLNLKPSGRQQNLVATVSFGPVQEQAGLTLYYVNNINHLDGVDEIGARIEYKYRW